MLVSDNEIWVTSGRRYGYGQNGSTGVVTQWARLKTNQRGHGIADPKLVTDAGIAYSVCGGVAVCLYGYQRNTTDLDLVIRSADSDSVRRVLTEAGFAWDSEKAVVHTADGIAIQFLIAGHKAGKGTEVSVSEPIGELNVELIEGLSVVRLSRLIEMKIACGMSNLRRTHKDFADVVELIAIRHLDGSFARFLHKSLRPTFRELVRNASASDE